MDEEEIERIRKRNASIDSNGKIDEIAFKMANLTSDLNFLAEDIYKKDNNAGILFASSIISGIVWSMANNYDEAFVLVDKLAKESKFLLQKLETEVNKNG